MNLDRLLVRLLFFANRWQYKIKQKEKEDEEDCGVIILTAGGATVVS